MHAFSLKKINKRRVSNFVWSVFRTVLIVGITFMILYPVFVKFTTAIKSPSDMLDSTVVFIPKNPTFNNFWIVMQAANYPISLLKSIGITLLLSVLQIASCTMVAYGLARFKFPGRTFWFAMVIFTLVIPTQCILLPLYMRFQFFNPLDFFKFWGQLSGVSLTNTIIPFVLLSSTACAFKNGLYIYMLRQYYINMPIVLEEAAYIDGCGPYKTFLKIMLPGSGPMIITVFLFSFVWQWNDYYYTSILAPELPVLSRILMNMNFEQLNSASSDFNLAVINAPKFLLLILPLVILYLFTQRFFTQSIESSGIVG